MFRRSKRDKERLSKNSASPPGDSTENGIHSKRSSKLFSFGTSFGKKDRKKNECVQDPPENSGAAETLGGVPDVTDSVSSIPSLKPLAEEEVNSYGDKNDEKAGKLSLKFDRNNSQNSSLQRKLSSPSSSLGIDFGTDSSLLFQNFAADVLKATEEKLKNVDLKLPDVKKDAPAHNIRTVSVRRGPAGDFGIALRRSTLKKENSRIIHLVEPTNENQTLGLLPGDRLVEVDGINVENFSREEIIDKVSNAADSVTLKVAPVPELSELSSRSIALQQSSAKLNQKVSTLARSGSIVRSQMKKGSRSEKELQQEKEWLDSEKVWLLHQSGFSSGRLNKVKDEHGDIVSHKVKLDHGGEVVDVDEGYVDKINPPRFDKAEDLSSLRYLNESGCLHTLRQRYGGNLLHTYAGNCLIIIKPEEALGIYNQKVMKMFQGCKQEDMPPHIFAAAQTSYRAMLASNTNQSIVLRGTAGSGKTFNLKQILKYLSTVALAPDSCVSTEKLDAALSLIESFTHARTTLSCNASFARLLYTLNFDSFGLMIGCSIQNFFIDKARVSRTPPSESSYRIFYELLHGCSGKMQQDFMLDVLSNENNFLLDLDQQFSDKESSVEKWTQLQKVLEVLSITESEWKGLLAPIAAILHLGVAGVMTVPGSKPYFANPLYAQRAASILGTTEENLSRILFTTPRKNRSSSNLSRTSSSCSQPGSAAPSENGTCNGSSNAAMSPVSVTVTVDPTYDAAMHALEGFVSGLYVEVFNTLMRLINRALNTSARVTSILNIFDSPGFQNKSSINENCNFEDLCSNYCYEKMQWLTHYCMFTAQIDRYYRENIDCSYDLEPVVSPDDTIAAIDKLSTSSNRLKSSEAKGLFWIIEEEALRPCSNEILLVDNIKLEHKTNRVSTVVTTDPNVPETFIVTHLQNTMMVKYNTTGWLKRVREHPTTKAAYGVLTESNKSYVSELYSGHQSGAYQIEPLHGGRRKSRHALANMKKNSISMQMKTHMDRIIEILDRTTIRFVFCFLPDAREGLRDHLTTREGDAKTEMIFHIPFVRQQFKSSNLLEIMRIHRQGYPDHMSFPDFIRRFNILVPKEDRASISVLDGREAVCSMVKKLELEERSIRIGLSQIFFRAGLLSQLEDSRDETLSISITDFQALCRGYLSRKRLEKLRVHHLAIRCLQKNIRNFLVVRSWPWWRLYTKVLPLLDVHRTEQELQTKSSELTTLHGKIKSLEDENTKFTDENTRLKNQIKELSAQLSEIHSSASGADELLDQETLERMRLEEELERAKMETERLSKQCDSLESELCQMKLNAISNGGFTIHDDIDDGEDTDELEHNDNVWREKYSALSRELENTRRTLTSQAEEEIQELMNQKRTTEKALAKERSDGDEIRRQVTNTKRKLNKVNAEMEDMKLLLESVQCRNSDLEKKQRKFDHEMTNFQEELEQEKASHETSQRERDKLNSEKHNLQNIINEKDDEIMQLKRKVERLEEEINDIGVTGKADAELVTLKRQQREYDTKLQDQEEELDEQAGKIQQLEQAKTRLEMSAMREKQNYQRDIDAKDEEIEQMKQDCTRKLRAAEEQVDEETKKREEIMKAKRELEHKVFDLEASVDDTDNKATERRLKKELKRIKTLYNDAKNAVESQPQKTDQADLKALRNQLDDAEFAKHMALKAKSQIEADVEEYQAQIDSITQAKEASDGKYMTLQRENAELQARIDELEDEMEEISRNNRQLGVQLAESKNNIINVKESNRALEDEKIGLVEKVNSLTKKLESAEANKVEKTEVERLEVKIEEMEARLEGDSTSRIKQDHLVHRLRGQLGRVQEELINLQDSQNTQGNNSSKYERMLKEARNELEAVRNQESMFKRKKEEAESEVHNLEDELSRKKSEMNTQNKRIRELQAALEAKGGDSDDDDLSLLGDLDESDDSFTSPLRRGSSARLRKSFTKRANTFDVYGSTLPTSTYRSSRRTSNDASSYIPNNGYLSRDLSRDLSSRDDALTNSYGASTYTSRKSSKMASRQDSFE